MVTPYSAKPSTSFWRRSMAGMRPGELDPVMGVPCLIGKSDAVATAGSCFAQHIAASLRNLGFNFLVTERGPAQSDVSSNSYGVFPARFGNIYTVRHLLQLLNRAYGLLSPADTVWVRSDGRFVDPLRPLVESNGFASPDEVTADRELHLTAVRQMFEDCDVFIFTFGLTEAWLSTRDGVVLPLVPQAIATDLDESAYRFHNFSVSEMTADFVEFVSRFRRLNKTAPIITTVSPVPLVATFENRHVLTSNTFSKSALRVVADEVTRICEGVHYFPAYEIIAGPQSRSHYYDDDLREVTPAGVACVMSIFVRHYLRSEGSLPSAGRKYKRLNQTAAASEEGQLIEREVLRRRQRVICDEAVIESDL